MNNRNDERQSRKAFRNRLMAISLCLLAWSGLIMFKLVRLQILESERIKTVEAKRLMKKREIPALRGEIRDRNGKPLAISYYKAKIILDPLEIKKPEETAKALAEYLERDDKWVKNLTRRIEEKRLGKSRYLPLVNGLEYAMGRKVYEGVKGRDRDYRLAGVHVDFFPERHYPKRWLASHLVGFLSKAEEAYNEGLERTYNSVLAGKNGLREVLSDAMQNDLAIGGRILKEPQPGANLELTIDENIQFLVENEIQYGMKAHEADAITCIVVEPDSGDILAMANLPDFNPEHYGSPQRKRSVSRRNRAIEFQYEPASAFKIVTMATALDKGRIHLNDKVYCENGGISIYNRFIRDHKPFGNLTYEEVLWYSSNVGAIKAALKLEPQEFYESMHKFGFGQKTGIDLPSEISGHLKTVDKWNGTSNCFMAIGHEIGATPLQMLMAANVIATGGYLLQPRIGKKLTYDSGAEKELGADRPRKRVISSSTAAKIKHALYGVVEQGTAKKAAISGVKIFGKTGTAQRITQTGYSHKDYNASFVGFFPAEKPRYGMIVVVYNPQRGGVHGGEVAAPIFKRIGEGLLWLERSRNQTEESGVIQLIGGEKDTVDLGDSLPVQIASEPTTIKGKMPDVKGLGLKTALKKCASAGIYPQIRGNGWVTAQFPEPGVDTTKAGKTFLTLGEAP